MIQKQFNENISENLIQNWKEDCVNSEEKAKAKFSLKEKWFKENWTFEHQYKQEEDNKHKPNNNKKEKDKEQINKGDPFHQTFLILKEEKVKT